MPGEAGAKGDAVTTAANDSVPHLPTLPPPVSAEPVPVMDAARNSVTAPAMDLSPAGPSQHTDATPQPEPETLADADAVPAQAMLQQSKGAGAAALQQSSKQRKVSDTASDQARLQPTSAAASATQQQLPNTHSAAECVKPPGAFSMLSATLSPAEQAVLDTVKAVASRSTVKPARQHWDVPQAGQDQAALGSASAQSAKQPATLALQNQAEHSDISQQTHVLESETAARGQPPTYASKVGNTTHSFPLPAGRHDSTATKSATAEYVTLLNKAEGQAVATITSPAQLQADRQADAAQPDTMSVQAQAAAAANQGTCLLESSPMADTASCDVSVDADTSIHSPGKSVVTRMQSLVRMPDTIRPASQQPQQSPHAADMCTSVPALTQAALAQQTPVRESAASPSVPQGVAHQQQRQQLSGTGKQHQQQTSGAVRHNSRWPDAKVTSMSLRSKKRKHTGWSSDPQSGDRERVVTRGVRVGEQVVTRGSERQRGPGAYATRSRGHVSSLASPETRAAEARHDRVRYGERPLTVLCVSADCASYWPMRVKCMTHSKQHAIITSLSVVRLAHLLQCVSSTVMLAP